MSTDWCPIFHIAVLGPKEVGKTSIINRLVNNHFTTIYEPTDGDLRPYNVLLNINIKSNPTWIMLTIVDIFSTDHPDIFQQASTEEERNEKQKILIKILENNDIKVSEKVVHLFQIPKQFYGFMFVYDCTNLSTLDSIKEQIEHIHNREKKEEIDIKTKKILFGNKCDLINLSKCEDLDKKNETIKNFKNDKKCIHMFGSAALGYNIKEAFIALVKDINSDQQLIIKDDDWVKENIKSDDKEKETTKKDDGAKDKKTQPVPDKLSKQKEFTDQDLTTCVQF